MSNVHQEMNPALLDQLRPVVRRELWRRLSSSLAITWIALAFAGLLVLLLNRSAESALDPYLPSAWIWMAALVGIGSIAAIVFALASMPGAQTLAHRVEKEFPELDSVLLTAIEQTPDKTEGLSFFQYDVIRKAIHHSLKANWASAVPGWKILSSTFGAMVGLFGAAAASFMLFMLPTPEFNSSIHLFGDIDQPVKLNLDCIVQPGHVEIERGSNLLVLAEFPNDSPPEAELHYTSANGDGEGDEETNGRVVSMSKSLDDPVFASRIMQVQHPLTYHVEFGDGVSKEFNVSVFEFPRLVRTDVGLTYPKYTQLPPKNLQDTRRFSAVVGTDAQLFFNLNKEVTSATLKPEVTDGTSGEALQLSQNQENPLLWETNLVISQSVKYRLHLLDAQQRSNKSPALLTIKALVNQPPKLKLLEPARDLAVSALEEVSMSASVKDDFGVVKTGLAWSVGGGDTRELEIASDQDAKKRHVVNHLLELESLQAEPDQLVSWHFWAEDVGPDGKSRRTESDMFFAEVRRFDEAFFEAQGQQGQQQQQGQPGPSAQQAMELAELQKEIINATWRIIRREKGDTLTDTFDGDVQLLAESQRSAITQVDELAEKLNDEVAKSLVAELKSIMNDSVDKLQTAKDMPSAKPLTKALSSQQLAWQTLLKMRSREIQVQQGQQQSSQSSSSQASRQRQLRQMELTKQEDRYEQERLAQEENAQTQEQQENRQILSRLKELAERQKDLNKRVKELQSALEEAETEQEKEELTKQLKRLEEEQQQALRDTDDLQQRMEDAQGQQAEQLEQLQQARENVQRSSEALKEGDLSKAATEGTRAERELKDLRDKFQKQTAGQFNDQMRQMRNEAQEIQKEQEDLSEQLKSAQQNDRENNRLGGDDKRQQLVDGIKAGQKEVEDLREEIKKTIEEAEEIEPLLADELYDTYRTTEQSRPDRALEYSADAVERGFDSEAEKIHDVAMQGIEQLREGIDRAAERVLGDETEALKAARDTIKDLSRELDEEIERNDPAAEPEQQRQQQGQGEGARREEQGERQEGQPGKGNPSAGEQRSEQPQRGSGQPNGENQNDENTEPQDGQKQKPAEGQQGEGQQEGESQQQGEGQRGEGQQAQGEANQGQQNRRGGNRLDGDPSEANRLGGNAGPNLGRNFAPITGEDFRKWSDRLRDVEEMIADPDLRADAARIRDQAKAIRRDLKRHSPEPDWDKIKLKLAQPLAELQSRVTQEILRRDPKNTLVPLNREPVPARYENAVRKYYETLGTGK